MIVNTIYYSGWPPKARQTKKKRRDRWWDRFFKKSGLSRFWGSSSIRLHRSNHDESRQKQKKILTWRHNQFLSFFLQLLASQQRREPTFRVANRRPSFFVFSNIWWSFYQFSEAEKKLQLCYIMSVLVLLFSVSTLCVRKNWLDLWLEILDFLVKVWWD